MDFLGFMASTPQCKAFIIEHPRGAALIADRLDLAIAAVPAAEKARPNAATCNRALVLGRPALLTRLRLLLVKLLLNEHQDKASRVLVCDLLEGCDQAQHLKIFNSLGHGKDLIGKTDTE